jgi:hypothetical protein
VGCGGRYEEINEPEEHGDQGGEHCYYFCFPWLCVVKYFVEHVGDQAACTDEGRRMRLGSKPGRSVYEPSQVSSR